MTRKKLGLGLLETFSEACEVCAGRGVIVHHDPVVKHRTSNSANGGGNSNGNGPGGRRQRGGSNNGNGGGNGQAVRAGRPERDPQHHRGRQVCPGADRGLHDRSGRGWRVEAGPVDAAAEAPAVAERPKKARKKRGGDRKGPKSPAEQLLDSVLDALPEPKAPGQGRGRRRVSTAALTRTPVSVNSEPSAPSVAAADSSPEAISRRTSSLPVTWWAPAATGGG